MKIEDESVFDTGTISSSQFAEIATDHNKAAYASLITRRFIDLGGAQDFEEIIGSNDHDIVIA